MFRAAVARTATGEGADEDPRVAARKALLEFCSSRSRKQLFFGGEDALRVAPDAYRERVTVGARAMREGRWDLTERFDALLGSPDQLAGRVMALAVPDALPAAVRPGSAVDVWATDADADPVDPREILTAVDVIAVDRDTGDFATGDQVIEIFVPNRQVGDVMRALAEEHHLSVVSVPEPARD